MTSSLEGGAKPSKITIKMYGILTNFEPPTTQICQVLKAEK